MPRFFLHVRQGQELILDPEGAELPDLGAAQDEARVSFRLLVADRLRSSRSSKITDVQQIEVADDAGQGLATVHFHDALGSLEWRLITSEEAPTSALPHRSRHPSDRMCVHPSRHRWRAGLCNAACATPHT
ncbi:DUF6894 family protein [Belnapia arida]|uniref:DUF6894 family protein n=1 Tax=Belnapia arida TaxID=2804533 RepID=UPI0038B2AF17